MLRFMLPVTVFQVWYLLRVGPAKMAQNSFWTMALPCVAFYFPLAKYRDGRFFYSFFLACDVNAAITVVTYLLDYYLPGDRYIVMLVSRLIAFPLMEWVDYKWLRGPYPAVQRGVKQGWFAFAATDLDEYAGPIALWSGSPTLRPVTPTFSRRPADSRPSPACRCAPPAF